MFDDEDISVLKHHGILGMKWGVRRYQNEDGSLTEEGKRRYYQNDRGKYVKRNKIELKEYDRKKAIEQELHNNEPAKDIDDFLSRMNVRFENDPVIRKNEQEWHNIDDRMYAIQKENEKLEYTKLEYEGELKKLNKKQADNVALKAYDSDLELEQEGYEVGIMDCTDKLEKNKREYNELYMKQDEITKSSQEQLRKIKPIDMSEDTFSFLTEEIHFH